jgi:hypothetical protein
MLVSMAAWKRENPGRPVPLAMFATTANAVLWLWTTVGMAVEIIYQVLPAAFGFVQTVDVGLSRTLFSWTLHATPTSRGKHPNPALGKTSRLDHHAASREWSQAVRYLRRCRCPLAVSCQSRHRTV